MNHERWVLPLSDKVRAERLPTVSVPEPLFLVVALQKHKDILLQFPLCYLSYRQIVIERVTEGFGIVQDDRAKVGRCVGDQNLKGHTKRPTFAGSPCTLFL